MRRRQGAPALGALTVAAMTLADIPGVMEIENRSFPTPWSPSSFRHEIEENPYASLFVAKRRGSDEVIAFACVWVIDEEMKINNIAVHPLYRGRGVGARLLHYLLEFGAGQGCREATLEVRPSNETALRLYRRAGFLAVGRRKQYYSDTREDALVMIRPLGARSDGPPTGS